MTRPRSRLVYPLGSMFGLLVAQAGRSLYSFFLHLGLTSAMALIAAAVYVVANTLLAVAFYRVIKARNR